MSFGRPDAKVHFGPTGKPRMLRSIVRDEEGDLQITIKIDEAGATRIEFGRAVTYLALPADKAYDLAHLMLEHVKDKQGGAPVNITEDKIVAGLAHALANNSKKILDGFHSAEDVAKILLPDFIAHMAGEDDQTNVPIGEAQP